MQPPSMPSWTTTIAHGALAVMALHVADDSFLHPTAGTSAADHVVSGLVPIVVLGLAAWAYGRVRPGVAATAGVVVGLFGMTLAAEALCFWGETGLSGDDYTGLAAGLAGVVLVTTSATVLWTTRRRTGRRAWRYPRRALLGAAGVGRRSSCSSPRCSSPTAHLGTVYEDVTVHTADGLDLAGWYIPSRNGAAVLVYPGRAKAQKHARYLARAGYGVLLVDRRGEGASDGDPHGFGWTFDKDIEAGVRFLQHRDDVDPRRIAGLGLSVGGEMMLQTAAGTTGLAAVISDGAGARVMSEELSELRVLPSRSISSAWATRRSRVSSLFASRRRPGGRPCVADRRATGKRLAPSPITATWSSSRTTAAAGPRGCSVVLIRMTPHPAGPTPGRRCPRAAWWRGARPRPARRAWPTRSADGRARRARSPSRR